MTTARRMGDVDHYYWLTAFLAARDAQLRTCRVIAVAVLILGGLPLLLAASPAGPDTPLDRAVAFTVAAFSVLAGLSWLRRRWPTRRESAVGVVIGSVCTSAACLVMSDPVAGLLGAATFAILTAYAAFFHTLRLLTVVWLAAAVTLLGLGVRLAADAPLAAAGVVIVIAVNVTVAYACRTATRFIVADVYHGEIEPLTGLLNRDAFAQRAATLLASRSRDDDRYLVIVMVSIDSFESRVNLAGARAGDQVRVVVGQTLRENVRQNSVIAHVADAEFLIADTFTTADASPLVERLRGAVSTTPSGLTASIGVVSTPLRPLTGHPPDEVLDEVIDIATAAMQEARIQGGNRARYVLQPPLRVLANPETGD